MNSTHINYNKNALEDLEDPLEVSMCNNRWIYCSNLPSGPVDMVGRQVGTVMSSPQ